ncbi:C40 family peptidase [Flavobacterium sp. ACN6]|uniref:C40 family peptidase n=1 Tax=Flavobacterium sp. ACN6 TaxID=1920426 RepID=UPI000BB3C2AD|nr:C40 family peptidase [Flavobacterium sp. ACN6]PBJ14516.1 Gamma-DL-glutamyl hydrolase precursor [Flavobacterium sp. ACN6]
MKSFRYTLLLSVVLLFSFTCKKEEKQNKVTINKTRTEISAEINRDSIIVYAKKYLGTPYVYASSNPKKGFDCSGFVSYVYSNFGLTLPRSSSGYKNLGTALKPEDFKVGDILVFYGYKDRTAIGHLGIICEANGMHSKFIHASSGKAQQVTITALDTEHYTKRFYKCIDVLSK